MMFARKPWLGHYNGSRERWLRAYRFARSMKKAGRDPDPSMSGIAWKAQLIIANERDRIDPLSIPAESRLAAKRIIDELLEQSATD